MHLSEFSRYPARTWLPLKQVSSTTMTSTSLKPLSVMPATTTRDLTRSSPTSETIGSPLEVRDALPPINAGTTRMHQMPSLTQKMANCPETLSPYIQGREERIPVSSGTLEV